MMRVLGRSGVRVVLLSPCFRGGVWGVEAVRNLQHPGLLTVILFNLFVRCIVNIATPLYLCLTSGLILYDFMTKILYAYLISLIYVVCLQLITVTGSQACDYILFSILLILSIMFKYFLSHPAPKHHHSVFFPQNRRPSFTPHKTKDKTIKFCIF